mmetsp:Transcript_16930/g.22794  ORF Transcript_16930/g.22794 Transcript_16930/m.22794 type:complete len:198 (-) Transcript_16930:91-684(-)
MAVRKPLGLTFVLYEDGNLLSKILALATLTPIFAGVALLGALVTTRRLAWAWALLGAVLVDVACAALKELIQQPRPTGSYREGPGMPSEHAAFSTFLAVHLSLWVWARVRCPWALKALMYLALVAWTCLVVVSRHHLGVHSSAQLAVGSAIGAAAGAAWFGVEWQCRGLFSQLQRRVDDVWAWLDVQCEGYGEKVKS